MDMGIIRYEIEKLLKNKFSKFFLALLLFLSVKNISDFKMDHMDRNFTFMEGIIQNMSDKYYILWVIFPISLYYMVSIFFDRDIGMYIAIRSKSKVNWFNQKVISFFIYNCVITFVVFFFSFIVSILQFKFSFSWSHSNIPITSPEKAESVKEFELSIIPLQRSHSTVTSVIIAMVFLIFGLTLLGLIFVLISKIFNNARIGVIVGFIYLNCSSVYPNFASTQCKFIKYFTVDEFILVNNHSFVKKEDPFHLLYTIQQSIILMIILLIIFYFINIFSIKKMDVGLGD